MFNIKVDYPSSDEEEQILMQTTRTEKPEVRKVLSARAILNLQKLVGTVAVSEYIINYVARLVRATRPKDETAPQFVKELVDWGPAPGRAVPDQRRQGPGRDGWPLQRRHRRHQTIAVPVLRHRISTNFQAQAEGMGTEDIIRGCSRK